MKDVNKTLIVVDTPGFFDTNPTNTNHIVKNTITKPIFELTFRGIHAVRFILSDRRFGLEEQETVNFTENIFGPKVSQYGSVVLTHLDESQEDEDYRDLDTVVQQGPQGLQELVRKCGGRKFAINNKLKDHRLVPHIQSLVKMIADLVAKQIKIGYEEVRTGLNSDRNRWNGDSYDKTCTYARLYESGEDNEGFRGRGNLFDYLHDLRLAFDEQPRVSPSRRLLHKEEICDCPDNYKP